eukprot:COSAG01_NODE_68098_length_265_cov_0.620482_1_plen_22_part_01
MYSAKSPLPEIILGPPLPLLTT